MGKSKTKMAKLASEAMKEQNDDADSNPLNSIHATDGHNTQGWTDNEIRAYNELIVEREKLEKQKSELEEKCAKSQTQRALLHENVANIDTMFKQQNSVAGTYKYTGASSCVVDHDSTSSCHHETCIRAKTIGITAAEMSTIKYYTVRIHSEKSERVRSALRKQRDLELVRVRTEDEELAARTSKKTLTSKQPASDHSQVPKLLTRGPHGRDMNKAARETEKLVDKIIHQLDDLRSDLQSGKISPLEAQGKLNILDGKLPATHNKAKTSSTPRNGHPTATLKEFQAITTSFQANIKERLLDVQSDTFSQAFSIMDHFLGATKPGELQEAIADLKDVLQLSGPLCEELQNSLGALEGIFDNPDKLSFPGPDGKQECTSMLDLLGKLKDTLQHTGQLPEGANASLTKVFQDCIDLEAEAREQLELKVRDKSIGGANLPGALALIKSQYVSKSPIPPLTSKKLNSDISELIDHKDVDELLVIARESTKSNEVEAFITSLIIFRSQKDSSKYVERLERLGRVCSTKVDSVGFLTLRTSIENVLGKMRKRFPAINTEKENRSVASTGNVAKTASDVFYDKMSQDIKAAGLTSAVSTCKTVSDANKLIEQSSDQVAKTFQQSVRSTIEECGKQGLWALYKIYLQKTPFRLDSVMLSKAESYKSTTQNMLASSDGGVLKTVCYLYRLKLCPGMVAVLLCAALIDVAENSDVLCRGYLRELAGCLHDLPVSIMSADWIETFQYLTIAILQLLVAIYVESLALFPGISALHVAMTTVEWAINAIQLTRCSKASSDNMGILSSFLLTCFAEDARLQVSSIRGAVEHFRHFCTHDKFRCTSTGSCSKHMQFVRMPFKPSVDRESNTKKQTTATSVKYSHASESNTHLGEKVRNVASQSISVSSEAPNVPKPRKTTVLHHKTSGYASLHEVEAKDSSALSVARNQQRVRLRRFCGEKTASILRQRLDEYEARKLIAPVGLITALNTALNLAGADYYHPISITSKSTSTVSHTLSKFSEHFVEVDSFTTDTVDGILHVQNIFKRLSHQTPPQGYLESISKSVAEDVLSGSHQKPLETFLQYFQSLKMLAPIPVQLNEILQKAREDVGFSLKNPTHLLRWETRRLKYLLAGVGCTSPDLTTLTLLALSDKGAFHEYYEVVTRGLKGHEDARIRKTDCEHLVTIAERILETLNHEDERRVFNTFVTLAEKDWDHRQQTISKQTQQECKDPTEPTVSLGSSVEKPIMGDQYQPANIDSSDSTIERGHNSITAITKERCNSIEPSEACEHDAPQSVKDNYQKIREIESGSSTQEISSSDRTGQLNAEKCSNSSVGISGSPTVQYLLPDQGAVVQNATHEAQSGIPTPTSFRMLDMMKHVLALQKNSENLLQAARDMSKLNQEHGKAVFQTAERVAIQVDNYADFVQEIARWHGVELAKDGFSMT